MKRRAAADGIPVTGEVFTRPEVVEYMLRESCHAGRFRKIGDLRFLEPSCGEGAFVLPVVDALIAEDPDWNSPDLMNFLRACDISKSNLECVAAKVGEMLHKAGCPEKTVGDLIRKWFVLDDFLLHDFDGKFDVVIGNPPYIRFDDLAVEKKCAYRACYATFSERCDIYVPFFERALSLLSERGVFSFICTNRFTKSSYGKRLRALISAKFHVALYLNMEHAQPFVENVSAYPAIFVIDRKRGTPTFSATVSDASEKTLRTVCTSARHPALSVFDTWYAGDAVWSTTDAGERNAAESIRRVFPDIERSAHGTEIGIGVASGADDVFVSAKKNGEVEDACLLPLVASEDIRKGRISWSDRYIVNPYDPSDDSRMLDLARFPKTAAYFNRHVDKLKGRYCAKGHPDSWFRTLDRIKYALFSSPKILLPDIQLGGNVALDERGEYYPHHNVYWITSKTWSLRALCVLMRSSFVTDQIRRASVQMRGGSIRYQAQNLRNVHIPSWESLEATDVARLEGLYGEQDVAQIDVVVNEIVEKAGERQRPSLAQGELFCVS